MGKGKFCSFKCYKNSGHKENGTNSRLYRIWGGMKFRCSNKKDKAKWAIYGGKGITVCKEWKNHYLVFKQWALTNGYKDSLSIDRLNNDLGYSPTNCRWATTPEQNRNKTTKKLNSTQVRNIRQLLKTGKYTQKSLAKQFHVHKSLISYINVKGWV